MIGHDVVRPAALDLRRIDLESRPDRLLERQRERGCREQGVAALFRVAPGMRALPVDVDRPVAAAAARAGKGAVGQRRLVGKRGELAPRRLGEQSRRTRRTDLLVRIDHHLVPDPLGERRRLDRLQRRQHQRDAPLHVGNAGAVERVVVEPGQLLKRMILGEHRVHMAGQQHLHRSLGPHLEIQVLPGLARNDRAVGLHHLGRRGLAQLQLAGQCGKGIGQLVGHGLEPGEIGRTTVDLRPVLRLIEHRCIDGAVEGGGFGCGQLVHTASLSGFARDPPHHSPSS